MFKSGHIDFSMRKFCRLIELILHLHYVPGSSVCSKRSVPWNFGHIFLCFQDPLRLVKFSYVCFTVSVTSRGSDKPVCLGSDKLCYGYPRSITTISKFYYGLLCSYAVSCF